jgi:hypothetical protein
MTLDERTTVTRAIFSVGLGVSVLGGLLFFGIKELFTSHAAANSGDTPVILVGGSMTFKAGAYQTPQSWSTVTAGQEYSVAPSYQISTIVVKATAPADGDGSNPGDANPTTDKLRLDVSTASSWEIDEFTSAYGSNPVTKIFPKQNGAITEIHLALLDTNGTLCPVNSANMKRISYSPTKQCPAQGSLPDATFSQVSVTLNGDVTAAGTPQPSGTLNCVDSAGDPLGKCRIALKGTP